MKIIEQREIYKFINIVQKGKEALLHFRILGTFVSVYLYLCVCLCICPNGEEPSSEALLHPGILGTRPACSFSSAQFKWERQNNVIGNEFENNVIF